MPTASSNVRFQGQLGKHLLALSFSLFDPGCVKTCTSQECAELFSLSSSLSGGRKHFWFSNLRNRDGISTRRLNIGVFTRPRPGTDIDRGPSAISGSLRECRHGFAHQQKCHRSDYAKGSRNQE